MHTRTESWISKCKCISGNETAEVKLQKYISESGITKEKLIKCFFGSGIAKENLIKCIHGKIINKREKLKKLSEGIKGNGYFENHGETGPAGGVRRE